MIQYAILDRAAWDGRTERIQDCPGARIVGYGSVLYEAVEALTGRGSVLHYASCGRKLREGQRLYIAADRSPGARGVLVQKVS